MTTPTEKPDKRWNTLWHKAHPMPKKPTLAEKISWHLAHAAHCGCRPMPKTIENEIKARMVLMKQKPH